MTVPLGEPGDHGWFRLDDVDGWNRLFAAAGLFVEEQEAYELGEDGWRAAPAFRAPVSATATAGLRPRPCSAPSSRPAASGASRRPTGSHGRSSAALRPLRHRS